MRWCKNLRAIVRPWAFTWIKMGATMEFWVEMWHSDFCFNMAAVLKADWTAQVEAGHQLWRPIYLQTHRGSWFSGWWSLRKLPDGGYPWIVMKYWLNSGAYLIENDSLMDEFSVMHEIDHFVQFQLVWIFLQTCITMPREDCLYFHKPKNFISFTIFYYCLE